jgi:ATP-dependent helicase/nuclease subunit A
MRLLYVALTRAEHRLILAGTATPKAISEHWPKRAHEGGMAGILSGHSYLDWIGSRPPGAANLASSGQNAFFAWTVLDDDHIWLAPPEKSEQAKTTGVQADLSREALNRLEWPYPFREDTRIPAKAAVSALRREVSREDEEEARQVFKVDTFPTRDAGKLTAAEIGSAHHLFLEQVGLDKCRDLRGLQDEADRLVKEKCLTKEERDSLDLEGLAAFWQSEPGRQFLENLPAVRRELEFTARFDADELARLGAETFAGASRGEFVVVQGVIDLAAILPTEVWLLDFKTDHFPKQELNEKIKTYRPQIKLYAAAISRIYKRPVTRCWLHFLALRRTEKI